MTPSAMLELQGVTAGYTAVPVLHEVSIRVGEGQLVAVVGPNGAGKSTLFRTISGVLKPSAGSIRFNGVDIGAVPPARRPHLGIAHVPEGRRLFPMLSVADNLKMGAYLPTARARYRESLERVYALFPVLAERPAQRAGSLSGGEQQMLAIGRALMARPALLLLDEPSMGLSPILVETIFRIVQDINRQGTTILLVEQNARMALRVAHRGYVIQTGRIVLHDTAANLLRSDLVRKTYLGEK